MNEFLRSDLISSRQVHTSARRGYVIDDDLAYQEGAARFASLQRRLELDEHSAQAAPAAAPAPPLVEPIALLIGCALFTGFAAGFIVGCFVIGGAP